MTDIENTISLSREEIKALILSQMQNYLDLQNVDLTKSSFLSFMIETMTTLTNNLLFYSASLWKEYFLTKCQLPESIYEGAASLGYTKKNASIASVDALISMPMTFTSESQISIPKYSQFKANDIIFQTYYDTIITIELLNQTYTVTKIILNNFDDTIAPSIVGPFSLVFNIDGTNCTFILPLKQFTINSETYIMDDEDNAYSFKEYFIEVKNNYFATNVYVAEPSTPDNFIKWTEFNSLYLINPQQEGYAKIDKEDGLRFLFGNSLMGKRPEAGSSLKFNIYETNGLSGNIIPGSLTSGPSIYVDDLKLTYTVTNPSYGTGGDDSESLEEIRKNAITNLTALSRLVSKNDYENIKSIISSFPLSPNYIPILKRADIQGNEISIYAPIIFGSTDYFETNCIWYEIPVTSPITTTIPRETSITNTDEDSNFICIFDIEIDTTKKSANYFYYLRNVYALPTLTLQDETSDVNVNSQKVHISDNTPNIDYDFIFYMTGDSTNTLTIDMTIEGNTNTYNGTYSGAITDDTTGSISISVPKANFSYGELTHTIKYKLNGTLITQENFLITIKKNLKSIMKSNVTTSPTIVYDIPCIYKTRWDALSSSDKETFETLILQKIVSMDLTNYRMMSDFINIKFTKTIGKLNNILLNKNNKLSSVKQVVVDYPSSPSEGDRYIFTKQGDYKDNIITYIGSDYHYYEPSIDDFVTVTEDNGLFTSGVWFYSNKGWIKPDINVPFEIEIDVIKSSSYIGTNIELISAVKAAILSGLENYFGNDANIYRSQIIDIVQNVSGVDHCKIIKPEINLFFNYELSDLTKEELLKYVPTYIFTNSENITINIK